MKKTLLYVLAALVLISSTAFAAVSVSNVQTLWQEVNARIDELNAQTLTTAQQETLRTIQGDFMRLGRGSMLDPEREAKLEAFKATLSEAQKTAYEAIFPALEQEPPEQEAQPEGGEPGGAQERPTMTAPDLSELSEQELSEMETQLKGLLEKLNAIK